MLQLCVLKVNMHMEDQGGGEEPPVVVPPQEGEEEVFLISEANDKYYNFE